MEEGKKRDSLTWEMNGFFGSSLSSVLSFVEDENG
jgi:hypothetical protein